MVSPDTSQPNGVSFLVNQENGMIPSRLCLYCLTRTAHPRLGRGETYVCGYKPYRCEVCNYSTTTKGNLAIHQQSDKHLNNMQEIEQASMQRSIKAPSPQASTFPNSGIDTATKKFKACSKFNNTSSSPKTTTIIPSTIQSSMKGTSNMGQPSTKLSDQPLSLSSDNSLSLNPITSSHYHDPPHLLPEQTTLKRNGISTTNMQFPLETVDCSVLPTTGQFIVKLTETSPYPFACQVCCAFTTDKLDLLIEHAERNRIPLQHQDQLVPMVTVNTGGVWLCRLCMYRSPLKANFQLHCKTEKHSQRLNLLLHMCEGGPANQLRALVPGKCISSEEDYAMPNDRVNFGPCGPITNSASTRRGWNVNSPVQLTCLACDVYATSVHKFRIHCQCTRHIRAVELFSQLVSGRSVVWNKLANLCFNCVDLVRGLHESIESSAVLSNGSRISPNSDDPYNRVLMELSRLLVKLRVEYVCLGDCSHAAGEESGYYRNNGHRYFQTMLKALNHWHSCIHQQNMMLQSSVRIPNKLESSFQTEHEQNNLFAVHWVLNDMQGPAEQLPTLITDLMTLLPNLRDTDMHKLPSVLSSSRESVTPMKIDEGCSHNKHADEDNDGNIRLRRANTPEEFPRSSPPFGSQTSQCLFSSNTRGFHPSQLSNEIVKNRDALTNVHQLIDDISHLVDRSKWPNVPSSAHQYQKGTNGSAIEKLLKTSVPFMQRTKGIELKSSRSRPHSVSSYLNESHWTTGKEITKAIQTKRPKSAEPSHRSNRELKAFNHGNDIWGMSRPISFSIDTINQSMTTSDTRPSNSTEYLTVAPQVKMHDFIQASIQQQHTVPCQLCTESIPSSELLYHMAMHFIQLSQNQTTELLQDQLKNTQSSSDKFFSDFCCCPDLRLVLLNRVSKALEASSYQSPALNGCNPEFILLLSVEILAQQSEVNTSLYDEVDGKWFMLHHIQNQQTIKCHSCPMRFILNPTRDIHDQLMHPKSDRKPVSNLHLTQLLGYAIHVISEDDSKEDFKFSEHPEDLKKAYTMETLFQSPMQNQSSHGSLDSSLKHGLPEFLNSASLTNYWSHPSPIGLELLHSTVPCPSIPLDQHVIEFNPFVSTRLNNDQYSFTQQQQKSKCRTKVENTARKFESTVITEPCRLTQSHATALPGSESMLSGSDQSVLPRRSRTRLSDTQLMVLRSYFDINNSPPEEKIIEICQKTGLQAKVVKHWFRNTLFKERQRNKDNPYNFSIPPSTSLNLEEYEKTGRVEVLPTPMEQTTIIPDKVTSEYADSSKDLRSGNITHNTESSEDVFVENARLKTRSVSESSLDGSSLRVSDTDSSGITGNSPTPSNKRSYRIEDHSVVPAKRIFTAVDESRCSIPNAISCVSSPIVDKCMLIPQLINGAETMCSKKVEPSSPFLKGIPFSVMTPPSPCSEMQSRTNGVQLQQHLEAFVMAALRQNRTSTPQDNPESDLPLDLSTNHFLGPKPYFSTDKPSECESLLSDSHLTKTPALPVTVPSTLSSAMDINPYQNHVLGHIQTTSTISTNNITSQQHNGTGARRNRTSITLLQSRCMHSIYAHHKTPSVHECDRLGAAIGLSRRVVQVWFQNQRAKEKKLARVSSAYNNTSNPTGSSNILHSDPAIGTDSSFCHLCRIPIRAELVDNASTTTSIVADAVQLISHSGVQISPSSALTSNASFVDHMFSPLHLKNLMTWCSVDVSSSQQ